MKIQNLYKYDMPQYYKVNILKKIASIKQSKLEFAYLLSSLLLSSLLLTNNSKYDYILCKM